MTRTAVVRSLRALAKRRSVILCYHGLGPVGVGDPHFLRADPGVFRAQVEALLEAGFSFDTVAGIATRLTASSPPAGLAAISFDDGMEDNHSLALPILGDLGVPATVYVTTGMIGRDNPWLEGGSFMERDQLRELLAAGWELGAHTVNHPDLAELSYEDCLREMTESRATLEEIGAQVTTFAYPFCSYGPEALRAAKDAGFAAAVTCHGRGDWSAYELKRTMITGKDGWPSFGLKVAELWDPLFHSVPGRALRAGTRGLRARLRGGS
ncbi:MAG: hypothetical protein QOJ29_2220 [Thermoleophilaceae bacterium]|nr:hypothetical protein [Thermoleophilaceae bacterium]